MDSSLRTSASGMMAQQRMIDVIANNLANVNTTAFKRSRVSFEDVLYETVQGARITNPQTAETVGPVQIGKGVRIGAVLRLHAEGAPDNTSRPLDVAIQGEGFFQVQRPDGTTGYTRDGGFTLSDAGTVVTKDGHTLMPEVIVPPDATAVSISPNGIVTASLAGPNAQAEIGRIELARFLNPNGLLAVGQNEYTETPASGTPVTGFPEDSGMGQLLQGALESSNVEIVQEMTDMIAAQRAYEINAKAIQASDEMMQAAHDLIR
jgi:flagellar basal-body rod protein FlgG